MSLYPINGTYIVRENQPIVDYAEKYAFGFVVGFGGYSIHINMFPNMPLDFGWSELQLRIKAANLEYDKVGTWFDDSTGWLHVNKWEHVDTIQDARKFAERHNQRFIYDLRDQKTVAV